MGSLVYAKSLSNENVLGMISRSNHLGTIQMNLEVKNTQNYFIYFTPTLAISSRL